MSDDKDYSEYFDEPEPNAEDHPLVRKLLKVRKRNAPKEEPAEKEEPEKEEPEEKEEPVQKEEKKPKKPRRDPNRPRVLRNQLFVPQRPPRQSAKAVIKQKMEQQKAPKPAAPNAKIIGMKGIW